MKLAIVDSHNKRKQLVLNGLIEQLDAWSLPDNMSLLRKNMFSDKATELTWEDVLRMNPAAQKGYNLYIGHLDRKVDLDTGYKISMTMNCSLVRSIDGETAILDEISSLSSSYSYDVEDNEIDQTKIVETSIEIPVNKDFDNSFAVAIINLTCNELPIDTYQVKMKLRTDSGEEYWKNLKKIEDKNAWIPEDGVPEKAVTLVEIDMTFAFNPAMYMIRQYMSLLNGAISFYDEDGIRKAIPSGDTLQVGSATFVSKFEANKDIYTKDDIKEILVDRIDDLSSSFDELIALKNSVLDVIPNLLIPEPIKVPSFTVDVDPISSVIEDAKIPEDLEDITQLIHIVPTAYFELSGLTDGLSAINDLKNAVSATLSTTTYAFNLDFYSYIEFSCRDDWTEKWLIPDFVKINNEEVPFTWRKDEEGKYIITIKRKVTRPYKLNVGKRKYLTSKMFLIPKIAFPGFEFDPFYFSLDLNNISDAVSYMLTWGDYPFDLDFHVYSFDSNWTQREHVYYKKKKETESYIYLDYDDRNSFGPENVQIFNPDPSKYYLLNVHNYSLRKRQTLNDAHMNYAGETKLTIKYYDKKIVLSPNNDGTDKTYWWDAFILHENRIYVIDSLAQDLRTLSEEMNYENNVYAKEKLIEKFNNARFSISLLDLKNSLDDIDASLKTDN